MGRIIESELSRSSRIELWIEVSERDELGSIVPGTVIRDKKN